VSRPRSSKPIGRGSRLAAEGRRRAYGGRGKTTSRTGIAGSRPSIAGSIRLDDEEVTGARAPSGRAPGPPHTMDGVAITCSIQVTTLVSRMTVPECPLPTARPHCGSWRSVIREPTPHFPGPSVGPATILRVTSLSEGGQCRFWQAAPERTAKSAI